MTYIVIGQIVATLWILLITWGIVTTIIKKRIPFTDKNEDNVVDLNELIKEAKEDGDPFGLVWIIFWFLTAVLIGTPVLWLAIAVLWPVALLLFIAIAIVIKINSKRK